MYVPANAGSGLPVMVEIHGGGFLIGGPPSGSHLAAAGHVIVIAIHYRLGILSFLAHKGLGDTQATMDCRISRRRCAGTAQHHPLRQRPAQCHAVRPVHGGASVCAAAVSPAAAACSTKGSAKARSTTTTSTPSGRRNDCKSELLTEAQAEELGASF
jgi:para-nitrobenzyl esterase